MSTTTLPFTKASLERIVKGMSKPLTETRSFFQLMGVRLDQKAQITFRTQGAREGHAPWPPFSVNTLQTFRGTWNLRYGTDMRPKRTAAELKKYKTKNNLWFVPGPMKGYRSNRRYGRQSQLLQASGGFRKSFRVIRLHDKGVLYGTQFPKADKIMGNPDNFKRHRPVLFMMPADYSQINRLWFRWYDERIKI